MLYSELAKQKQNAMLVGGMVNVKVLPCPATRSARFCHRVLQRVLGDGKSQSGPIPAGIYTLDKNRSKMRGNSSRDAIPGSRTGE